MVLKDKTGRHKNTINMNTNLIDENQQTTGKRYCRDREI